MVDLKEMRKIIAKVDQVNADNGFKDDISSLFQKSNCCTPIFCGDCYFILFSFANIH